MKNIISFIAVLLCLQPLVAQNVNSSVTLKELEVPASPAFILTESTPSLIQTPTTPKSFVLGVAQSFEPGSGFPQNYSAEFAPYWWFSSADRNVYSLLGLARDPKTGELRENKFAGLKFTSLSVAFMNKDLIPDEVEEPQKMFSIGLRSTIIKVHSTTYATKLQQKIADWHEAAQAELAAFQERATRADSATAALILREAANYKPSTTSGLLEEINTLFLEKPLFSWDIAAAHATYGIGDSLWKSGRTGIWTNLASYIPLAKPDGEVNSRQYLNLNFSVRFLSDRYFLDDKGNIGQTDVVDVGGKIALEFNAFSIGYEYLKRSGKNVPGSPTRSVGVINYRITDNLYLNGGFGKNFQSPDKLVALLGINWGLGKEALNIPD